MHTKEKCFSWYNLNFWPFRSSPLWVGSTGTIFEAPDENVIHGLGHKAAEFHRIFQDMDRVLCKLCCPNLDATTKVLKDISQFIKHKEIVKANIEQSVLSKSQK